MWILSDCSVGIDGGPLAKDYGIAFWLDCDGVVGGRVCTSEGPSDVEVC